MFVFTASGKLGQRATIVVAVLALPALLPGCALNPFDDDHLVKQAATAAGMATRPADAPGFVRETRPAEFSYPPVGVTPPARAVPLKTRDGLEKTTADLAAQRTRNEAAAGAAKPRSPYDGRIEPGYKPPPPPPLPE